MGYTHYWRLDLRRKTSSEIEKKYQQAILECQRVVRAIAVDNQKLYHSTCLSGYTAHAKIGQYGGLKINGKGADACEDFIMREHFAENEAFGCCKTGRGHYDFAVVACLAILKYRLGDAITVTSDGNYEDWVLPVEYAARKLRRKISFELRRVR